MTDDDVKAIKADLADLKVKVDLILGYLPKLINTSKARRGRSPAEGSTPIYKKYVGHKEASEITGVHEQSIRRWIKEGKLKTYKVGQYDFPRIKVEDLTRVEEIDRPAQVEVSLPPPKPAPKVDRASLGKREYLNAKDAAKYLGKHRNSLLRYVRIGRLQQYKVPGYGNPQYKPEDLDKLRTR